MVVMYSLMMGSMAMLVEMRWMVGMTVDVRVRLVLIHISP